MWIELATNGIIAKQENSVYILYVQSALVHTNLYAIARRPNEHFSVDYFWVQKFPSAKSNIYWILFCKTYNFNMDKRNWLLVVAWQSGSTQELKGWLAGFILFLLKCAIESQQSYDLIGINHFIEGFYSANKLSLPISVLETKTCYVSEMFHFIIYFSGSLPDYKVVKAVPVFVVEDDPRKETKNSELTLNLLYIHIHIQAVHAQCDQENDVNAIFATKICPIDLYEIIGITHRISWSSEWD